MSGRILVLAMACLLAAAPQAGAQATVPAPGGSIETAKLEVSVSRTQVSTRLGESFGFASRIRNTGTADWSGLVAHLNVVGLDSDIYVDPEDWSEERTKDVPVLGPGETAEVPWNVKAVTGGHAAIYVTLIARADTARSLAISPAIDVRIAESTELNSGGVLPLAVGVPALLALATAAARRRRGRR